MAKRGCEKVYFAKHCIPKGQVVKPYYKTAFAFETILQIVLFVGVLIARLNMADIYIPRAAAMDIKLLAIPAAIIIAEIICLAINNGMVSKMTKEAKRKK